MANTLSELLGPKKSWTVTTYDPKKATANQSVAQNSWKEITPTLQQTAEQKQGFDYLSQALNKQTPTFSANQGVAKNEYTDQIKSQLASYLNRTQPQSVALAEQELQSTLQGNYDPNTSQYYQGVRQQADLNLNDALNRYSQGQYLKGNLRSTTTDTGRSRLLAENSANLNQILGNLALQERQNRLNAVNQAMQMGQYQSGEQLSSLNQLSSVSNYLTQQDQKAKDFEYQEWLRAQQQPLSIAQILAQTPVNYETPKYQYVGAV
jgi:hypothetical protein